MCRYRRMSDEACFSTWREKARAQIMVVALGREYEGRVRVVELACDREHLRFGETVRVQYNACRIAGKAVAGERIDLVDLNFPRIVHALRATFLAGKPAKCSRRCAPDQIGRDSIPIA